MKFLKIASIVFLLGFVVVVSGCIGQSTTNTGIENNTSSDTPTLSDCKNYYWYDNNNKNCDQKQFCGAFMYLGLHTFDTKEACVAAIAEQQEQVPESTYTINIENFAFSTSPLTIKKGESVKWVNKDSAPHTVSSDLGNELISETLNSGDSYVHVFNVLGSYEYHCNFHPGMKGTILVE